MSAKMNHEELVELLQEGKIGFLRFVMDSENADDYLVDSERSSIGTIAMSGNETCFFYVYRKSASNSRATPSSSLLNRVI
jgi:hypothetical protein